VSSPSESIVPMEHASDYDRATAITRSDAGWSVNLDGSWSIGGSMNGGYLLAILTKAASDATSMPDPMAVTATFLSPPSSGPAEITVTVVKHGRRSSVADVALHQGGTRHVTVTAVLGDLDTFDGPNFDAGARSLTPLDDCISLGDRPGPNGMDPPEIIRRFDTRLAPGIGWLSGVHPGATGHRGAVIEGWTRFADGREPDVHSLMLFADGFPPAILDLFRARWVPTLQFSVYVRARPEPGWIWGSFRTRSMVDGLLDEDGELFDSAGRLVAQSRQLALLIPPA
jgi:Thioesterase-like superfamily